MKGGDVLENFSYFIDWVCMQEQGSWISYEKGQVQTYAQRYATYRGAIHLNGMAVASYSLEDNSEIKFRFKKNSCSDIAYDEFKFKRNDNLNLLLKISDKYKVCSQIYDYLMKF